MKVLKYFLSLSIIYKFYNLLHSIYIYYDEKTTIAETFYSEAFAMVLKQYLNMDRKVDWIGRLYGVVNPNIDSNGKINLNNTIIELDGDNTNNNEYVKIWIYKQLNMVAELFKIHKLYDFIDLSITHVGPKEQDNYLLVFDIVARKQMAEAAKSFFKQLSIYGIIAAVIIALLNIYI